MAGHCGWGYPMTIDNAIRGGLFAPDFLNEPESIGELPEWNDLDAATMDEVKSRLCDIFDAFPRDTEPNETQTEDDLIWKTLNCLGWTEKPAPASAEPERCGSFGCA